MQASSSVTTSTGRNSFHSAEVSPVSGAVDSETSFQSAAEALEDIDFLHFGTCADSENENEQANQGCNKIQWRSIPLMTEDKTSPTKPKLALRIPRLESSSNIESKSTAHLTSAASNSASSVSSCSLTSSAQTSRIPRVVAPSKIYSARGATWSAAPNQVQPVKLLKPKVLAHGEQSPDKTQLPVSKAHTVAFQMPLAKSSVPNENLVSGRTWGVADGATLTVPPDIPDPVLMDSAIIYSRKKSDAFGTKATV